MLAQPAAEAADEDIVGAQREDAFQRGQVHVLAEGAQHGLGLFDHVAHLFAQGQRARVGASPRQRTSTGSPTASRMRARLRLMAGVLRLSRRAAPTTLPLDQDVQGDEQVEVQRFHARKHTARAAP